MVVHESFLATQVTSRNSSFSSAKRLDCGGGWAQTANCKQLCASVRTSYVLCLRL